MSSPQSPLRFIPYAAITAVGMLATDLTLPALPAMREALHAPLALSQATMSVFLIGLAISQLGWGAACDRYGAGRALLCGLVAFVVASVACAASPTIEVLLAARAMQGIAAGVTTVAVPVLVTRDLEGADALRALAWVGIAESMVPAIGPVIGAALVSLGSFRVAYGVLAALGLVAVAEVARRARGGAAPQRSPAGTHAPLSRAFLRLCASHAIALGALIAFVASAPELIGLHLAGGPRTFATLQIVAVATFAICASNATRVAATFGRARAAWLGAALQALGACVIGVALRVGEAAVLDVGWAMFCGGMGFRGPVVFAAAMQAAGARSGAGAAWIMLSCQAAAALLTQGFAALLRDRPTWIAGSMMLASVIAVSLLPPSLADGDAPHARTRAPEEGE